MKRYYIVFVFIILAVSGYSQSEEQEKLLDEVQKKAKLKRTGEDSIKVWKYGGGSVFTFSQTSFTNWAKGGDNSMAANLLMNIFANYKKDNSTWDNILELGYGIINVGENGLRKSEDKIDLSSKYGRKAVEKLYYSALINFKSQFSKGYDYPNDSVVVSNYLAPGYILTAIGLDYKPKESITIFLSPLTGKVTIVDDEVLADSGAYGVEKAVFDTLGNRITAGKKFRSEFGGYLKVMYKEDIFKNVNFQTKLELFSNYSEEPENVDLNWEILVTMKLNKFLSVNFSSNLLYDHDIDITDKDGSIGPRTQYMEVFGIGFSYKF